MSEMSCALQTRIRSSLLLIVAALLLAPATAGAARHTVVVPPPNGVDDTASIQVALDECVAQGPGCTVQLGLGIYRTSQLLAHNFRGSFKGVDAERSVIEALPDLPVNAPPDDPNPFTKAPNLTDTLWPDLLIFVDGDVSVSDVGFRVTSMSPMQTWGFYGMEFHEMLSAVRVMMSQGPMNVSIRRISVEGLADETSLWGYNVINCVIVAGEQPTPTVVGDWRQDHVPFTGNVAITDNSFRGCASSDYFSHHIGSHITVARNISEGVGYAVEQGNVEGSVVEISRNRAAATQVGVILYNPYYPAEKASLFNIRDNDLHLAGPTAWDGIALYDNSGPGEAKSQNAVISGNTVETQGAGGGAIHAVSTRGTQIWGNRIAGSATAGVWLEGATRCTAVENRVAGFVPAPDQARIVLDAGTSHCLVAGKYAATDVLDLGSDNVVIGRRP